MARTNTRNDVVFDWGKQERNRESRKNIVTGAILRDIHKKQGTMPYLIQVIEYYLTKDNRKFLVYLFKGISFLMLSLI